MCVKCLTSFLISLKSYWWCLVYWWLQFQFSWTSFYLQKYEISQFVDIFFWQTYFKSDLIIINFRGLEVKIRVILIESKLLFDLGDKSCLSFASVSNKALWTIACHVFISGWTCSSIKTVTYLVLFNWRLSVCSTISGKCCHYYEWESPCPKSFINHFYNFIFTDLITILKLTNLDYPIWNIIVLKIQSVSITSLPILSLKSWLNTKT